MLILISGKKITKIIKKIMKYSKPNTISEKKILRDKRGNKERKYF